MKQNYLTKRQLSDLEWVAAWLKNYLKTGDRLSEGDMILFLLQRVIDEESTKRSLPALPRIIGRRNGTQNS